MYYKLKAGFSGFEKFITEEEYFKLNAFDTTLYEKAKISQCAAHERDSVSNLEYEESPENLSRFMKQTNEFYD